MMELSRRRFLKTVGVGLAALGAGAAFAESRTQPVKNVLLLYVDDLRPEINCYGKSKLITPNLDRLAKRSVVFNRAYCQVPVCGPSRVSTLSGLYPKGSSGWSARGFLSKGLPSLPGYFKSKGYDTISIGKVYHVNNDDPKSWTKRYTHTFGEKKFVCDGWSSGYQLEENLKGRTYAKTGRNSSALTECVDAPDSAYPDGMSADKAVADIKKYAKSGKPLFMAAGFYRPHLPWVAPKKYWDMYKRQEIDLASNQFFPAGAVSRNTWGDLIHYGDKVVNAAGSKRTDWTAEKFPVLPADKQRELIHGYWACVSFIDAQIGRILDALDKNGMKDNTMVVLLSDHGWQLGEHRLWSKCSNYEEAIRVPLIIAAPGITDGKNTDALVELVDIYPTLCEFAGLAAPRHIEGLSMIPLLKDPSRKWKTAAFNVWGGARSMRTERYRLTVYNKPRPKGGAYQLPVSSRHEIYDYKTDPKGNTNIAANPKNKPLLDKLTKMLNAGPKAARPKT
jgi:iduronate 2-sulfatase